MFDLRMLYCVLVRESGGQLGDLVFRDGRGREDREARVEMSVGLMGGLRQARLGGCHCLSP